MERTDAVADNGRPATLADLSAAITAVAHLDPIARFRALGDLTVQARDIFTAEKDKAVYEATAELEYEQVAEQLGIAYSNVNNRISAHRARTGEPARRGRRLAPRSSAPADS